MSRSDFVVLRGGLTLPTDADRALIRHWKPHLLAIVSYDADTHGGPQ